jgi:hypothetical protein
MSVVDGQKANAAIYNAAFVSKTADSTAVGVLDLNNITDVNSGARVTNVQRAINELFDAVGMTGIGDSTRKNYSSTSIIANGDSHKAALGKLDSQVALNSLSLASAIIAPASTTDNAVTRWDGTGSGGFKVQNSGVIIDDSNNVTGVNDLTIGGNLTVSGTTTTVNTATMDVADKNITVSKGGNDAASEGAGLTVDRTSTKGSFIFAAAAATKFKIGLLGAEVEIADISTAQTFTNKTFTSPTVGTYIGFTEQGSTPSTPSSGTTKVYVKTDGKLYKVSSDGIESQIGSGSGGSKNYLGNIITTGGANAIGGDIESGSVSGFVKGNTTLDSTTKLPVTPTFGSGYDANFFASVVSSGQLSGTYSLSAGSTAAIIAGDFFATVPFYIDKSDQTHVLTVSFAYKYISSAAAPDFSGTKTNTIGVAIYDVTNSAIIQVASPWGMNRSSGVGKFTSTFQASASGTQYRVIIFFANALASAGTFYFDDFSVSPIGAAADGRVIAAKYTGALSSTIPSSATTVIFGTKVIDQTGSMNAGTGVYTCPIAGIYRVSANIPLVAAGTLTRYDMHIRQNSANKQTTFISPAINTVSALTGATLLNCAAGDTIDVTVNYSGTTGGTFTDTQDINIERLSGPTSGDEGRVVAFRGTQSSQALTANTTDIAFTASNDTHAAWSGTAYVVQISGYYLVSHSGYLGSTATIDLYQNAVNIQQLGSCNTGQRYAGYAIISCKAGDSLTVRSNATTTLTSGILIITRLTGPAVATAQETVAASYSYSSTQSFANNTTVTMTPDSKVFDTHNAYSTGTGLLTVPISGKWRVSAFTNLTSLTASNGTMILAVIKNGSIGLRMARTAISIDTNQGVNGSIIVSANAGDTLGATLFQSNGATRTNETGIGWVQFERIGN